MLEAVERNLAEATDSQPMTADMGAVTAG